MPDDVLRSNSSVICCRIDPEKLQKFLEHFRDPQGLPQGAASEKALRTGVGIVYGNSWVDDLPGYESYFVGLREDMNYFDPGGMCGVKAVIVIRKICLAAGWRLTNCDPVGRIAYAGLVNC